MRTTRGLPSATTLWLYSTLLVFGYLGGHPNESVQAPGVVVEAGAAASPLAAADPLPVRSRVAIAVTSGG
jgi:hypothetical protein